MADAYLRKSLAQLHKGNVPPEALVPAITEESLQCRSHLGVSGLIDFKPSFGAEDVSVIAKVFDAPQDTPL